MIFKFRKHLLITIVLSMVFITGLLTYKTYGTYWDEYLQRDMGKMSYNYVFHHDDALKTFMDRDYAVLIELPLYAMEVKLFANDYTASIEARHLCCFLIFFIGLIFFYALLLKLKLNELWATLGVIMLVLSPRIYGHAFFNSKDIPLMVLYIVSFYTLFLFINKQSYKYMFLHALATGLLINVRITGVIIVPFTLLFLVVHVFVDKQSSFQNFNWLKLFKLISTYLIISAVFVYMFWPFLWEQPFTNFMTAYTNMSKFRWDNYTYLMGEHIRATEAPWYYLPKWIAISTPVFYLLAFALSLLVLPINFLKNKAAFFKEKNNLNQIMVLSFLIIPILVIIILHSTLYDSWRHVYFVYPFIIISGLYALTSLSNYLGKRAWIIVIVCALFTGFEFVKMINSHPFHYVYFNEIAGRNRNQIVQQNDFDFWGVSFKQAFEKILELDNRNDIKVTSGVSPAYYNFLFMKHNSKDTRLNYVFEEGLADYYITNYRYNPNDHAEINDKKFFSLEYANSEFITVFKLK